MIVMHYDETETGPRLRKTLTDKNNITPALVRGGIGGLLTEGGFAPRVDLYTYTRPSNDQQVWFVEVESYYPPDVQLWQSWLLDAEPTDAQIRDIVAGRYQEGVSVQ